MDSDRFKGALQGLALGDAFGAPYEGGLLERACWALIGRSQGKRRFTDDTQMIIDLAESLISNGHVNQDDLAQRFARSYRWSRGYGPGTARVLKLIRRGHAWEAASRAVYPGGSFGNGGAMRAPALGLFYAAAEEQQLVDAVYAATVVTHAHPLAVDGAVIIALATALACRDSGTAEIFARLKQQNFREEFSNKLDKGAAWLESTADVSPRVVARELGNGIAAVQSCVSALYAALAFRAQPFNELLAFCLKLGGDVDTIAAMAGAIWGAGRGCAALPREYLEQLEQRQRIADLAVALANATDRHFTGE
jgi:poly(ADP-ribose) glycohydrolase ARH3